MSNVTIQKRGKYYQYKFEIAKVDGKRKFVNKSGFKTKAEAEILYSAHNGTVDGENPDTYVSLMKKNYDNILKSITK